MSSRPSPADDPRALAEVRSELQRLGYLHHGLERFLLQDALRPRRPWWALLRLAAKVGLPAGAAVAVAVAFGLAAANGNLEATPFDLVPLALHLVPPFALAFSGGFLALGAALVAILTLFPVRRIETLALVVALVAVAAALAAALVRVRALAGTAPAWQLAVLAVALPLVVWALVRLVHGGLLSLAIRLTDAAPRARLFSRRGLGAAIAGASFLCALPAVLAAGRAAPPPAPPLPAAPGDRVLLVGVDGVLPQEADYLLARGELPALGRGLAGGGAVFAYRRPEGPPAAFWTSVATGLPAPAHGVASLDSFRPRGVATPLARSGPLRAYWERVEVPLGLAEYRPVLSSRRRAFAVWELASRGGAPVVAVDWWSTFPAEPLPGLVVAHGAFQLLGEGTAGAVAPESERAGLVALREELGGGPAADLLAAAMPAPAAAATAARATAPDRFYREAFRRAVAARQPRAAALYLPALDLAADGWAGGDVAFADLVRAELVAMDGLVGEVLGGEEGESGGRAGHEGRAPGWTVAVVLDPGRRGGTEGRAIVWREGKPCTASLRPTESITPEQIAAGLLAALGLPRSAELPDPPTACPWPPPPTRVPTYGARDHETAAAAGGADYLESLKALGYL